MKHDRTVRLTISRFARAAFVGTCFTLCAATAIHVARAEDIVLEPDPALVFPLPEDEVLTPDDLLLDEVFDEVGKPPTEQILEKIEVAHATVSERIERSAQWLDGFFASDRIFDEATDTYARVNLDTVFEPRGEIGFAGDLRLKIDLPRTERRLKLLIESDPQRETRDDLQDVPADVVSENNFSLSLERQLREARHWDIRPAIGVKAHTPLDPFTRLRAIRYFGLGKVVSRVAATGLWFDSSGWGANLGVEFDRAIGPAYLARSGTGFGWEEEDKFRRITQEFSLFHRMDEHRNMAYQIGVLADDEFDWDVNTYYWRVRFRKDIHEGWLFAEIIPQVTYHEETDFDDEPSLTLRLEAVFGRSYAKLQ